MFSRRIFARRAEFEKAAELVLMADFFPEPETLSEVPISRLVSLTGRG
jgi:hypothetical protein